MFIKFGDKTKQQEVSESDLENDETVSNDKKDRDADDDNRRIPILKSYKKVTQKNILYNKKFN